MKRFISLSIFLLISMIVLSMCTTRQVDEKRYVKARTVTVHDTSKQIKVIVEDEEIQAEPTAIPAAEIAKRIAEKKIAWQNTKPRLEEAVRTKVRCDNCGYAGNYITDDMTWQEQVAIHRLVILGGGGSYTDFLIPSMRMLTMTYRHEIESQASDVKRKEVFETMLRDLIGILVIIDDHVWTRKQFRMQATDAYKKYCVVNQLSEDNKSWKNFRAQSAKFGGDWPGFYSSAMGSILDNDGLNWEAYHQDVRDAFTHVLLIIRASTKITVSEFHSIIRETGCEL